MSLLVTLNARIQKEEVLRYTLAVETRRPEAMWAFSMRGWWVLMVVTIQQMRRHVKKYRTMQMLFVIPVATIIYGWDVPVGSLKLEPAELDLNSDKNIKNLIKEVKMRTKFYFLILLGFLLLLFHYSQKLVGECPECNYSEALLGINDENSAFLWYFTFYNIFDTVSVECTIGEFYYENNGVKHKIFPRIDPSFVICNWRILGQNGPGEDTILTQLVRTKNFIYQPNSNIIFYRDLMVGVSCGSDIPRMDTNANYGDDAPF